MAELADIASPQELSELSTAGFTPDEINSYRIKSMQKLADAGYSKEEIDKYYGTQEPDMTPMKNYIKGNLDAIKAQDAEKKKREPVDASVKPIEAKDFLDEIAAGFAISVSGLISQQSAPALVSSHDSSRVARIAGQAATLVGDLPAMVAGFQSGAMVGAPIGGAIGSVVPGAGTLAGVAAGATVGGSAGAFALPAAMRGILMQHYEKGDIKDFADFWDRSNAVLYDTLKQATVGAATGGAGLIAGKALGPVASEAVKNTGKMVSEVTTMVGVGKAIEGEVPNADDFIDAAILVGGLHAVSKVGKYRTVYEKTGIKPEKVAELAETDATIKQDLLSDNIQLPRGLEPLVEKPNPDMTKIEVAPTAEPAPAPTYTEAQQKILSKIGTKAEKTKERYSFNKFYTDFVDKLDPLKQAETESLGREGSKNLSATESPYKQARLVNDYKSKAKAVFEHGTFDFNDPTKVTGKSLNKIIEPHLNDLEGFKAYIVADRAIELEGRGIKSGFDVEAAKQVVKEGKAKYGEASDRLIKLNHEMLRYLKDAGRLDQNTYEAILSKNQRYTSGFSRILDDVESGGTGSAKLLKEIKGSDLAIEDPLITTVKNVERVFKLAEVNRARKTFVDFANKNAPDLLTKVDGRPGIEGKNEFTVWEDGKRSTYETDPGIAKTLKELDGNVPAQNFLIKMMRFFTSVKRFGITMTPDFIISNGIRDFITSGTFSTTSRGPFSMASDQLVAIGDIIGKKDSYYQWLKSGGSNGAFFEIDNRYIKNEIFKLDEQTGFISKAHNLIKKPLDFMEVAANLVESAPRLAEFKRTLNKTGDIRSAGFAAREITVDFQRIGAKMSALNAITAFQNVSIQGLDRTVRAVKDNPTEVGSKVAAYIVAPSVLLWYANHNDERYKEIPRWEKDTYWHIITDDWVDATPDELSGFPPYLISEDGTKVNKGTIYRIKKPQELGLVGSAVERTLEMFFSQNPDAVKDFDETIRNLVTPSLIPDALVPPLEHMTNQSFFTGRPIVPGYLEKELPYAQYTDYTSETAKALGKLISYIPKQKEAEGLSPMEIENYIRGWSGTLGMYAVQISDAALIKSGIAKDPVKPAWTVADIPAVKTFVTRYPSASAQSIQSFYEIYDRNEKVINTMKNFIKQGDEQGAQDVQIRYGYAFGELGGVKQALSSQSAVIRNVQRNPDMSPEEKRQIIESTYFQMIEIAKMGLEYGRALESQLKQDKDLEGAN